METFYNFTVSTVFCGRGWGHPDLRSVALQTPATNQWKYKTITQWKDRIACKGFKQFPYQ